MKTIKINNRIFLSLTPEEEEIKYAKFSRRKLLQDIEKLNTLAETRPILRCLLLLFDFLK